jgi:hypothetical protein
VRRVRSVRVCIHPMSVYRGCFLYNTGLGWGARVRARWQAGRASVQFPFPHYVACYSMADRRDPVARTEDPHTAAHLLRITAQAAACRIAPATIEYSRTNTAVVLHTTRCLPIVDMPSGTFAFNLSAVDLWALIEAPYIDLVWRCACAGFVHVDPMPRNTVTGGVVNTAACLSELWFVDWTESYRVEDYFGGFKTPFARRHFCFLCMLHAMEHHSRDVVDTVRDSSSHYTLMQHTLQWSSYTKTDMLDVARQMPDIPARIQVRLYDGHCVSIPLEQAMETSLDIHRLHLCHQQGSC